MAARYRAAMAALPESGKVSGIGPALTALAPVTGPEYDLGLYYALVLRNDPWQARQPADSLHGLYTQAKTQLAGAIATAAMDTLRTRKTITAEDVPEGHRRSGANGPWAAVGTLAAGEVAPGRGVLLRRESGCRCSRGSAPG